jgi:hypothetical protein
MTDALQSPESSSMGMVSTLLGTIALVVKWYVGKANKERERAMAAVPPTPPPLPATDSALRERIEQLEFDLGRIIFDYGVMRDKLSEARRELNEVARDQAQTANALKLERAQHLETQAALDEARHLARQAQSHAERLAAELHERVRSTESGYTRLPDMRPPEQIHEEDASPTPRPRHRRR